MSDYLAELFAQNMVFVTSDLAFVRDSDAAA
jgi:hypothetical protein